MKHTEEINIDGRQYFTMHYTPDLALDIFDTIRPIILKALGVLASTGMDAEVTPDVIGQAIDSFISSTNGIRSVELFKKILQTTQIKDENKIRDLIFAVDFSGRIFHLHKLVKAVLWFQYADFLEDLTAVQNVLAVSPKARNRIQAK